MYYFVYAKVVIWNWFCSENNPWTECEREKSSKHPHSYSSIVYLCVFLSLPVYGCHRYCTPNSIRLQLASRSQAWQRVLAPHPASLYTTYSSFGDKPIPFRRRRRSSSHEVNASILSLFFSPFFFSKPFFHRLLNLLWPANLYAILPTPSRRGLACLHSQNGYRSQNGGQKKVDAWELSVGWNGISRAQFEKVAHSTTAY